MFLKIRNYENCTLASLHLPLQHSILNESREKRSVFSAPFAPPIYSIQYCLLELTLHDFSYSWLNKRMAFSVSLLIQGENWFDLIDNWLRLSFFISSSSSLFYVHINVKNKLTWFVRFELDSSKNDNQNTLIIIIIIYTVTFN